MRRLFALVTRPTTGFRFAVTISRLTFLLVGLGLLLQPVVGLSLGLAALTALLLSSPSPNPRRQFLLCMIGLGLLLTALVEIVVLKGDISRVNTVFKFYFQVWVLWAIASATVLPQLAGWLASVPRWVRVPARTRKGGSRTPEVQPQVKTWALRSVGRWKPIWWGAFALLWAGCLLYPFTATPVRMSDRFPESKATTLDGSAFMRTSTYTDQVESFALDWDRQAAAWLRQNVRGIPVIVEANTPIYRWGSRVSIYTGLPTLIGWDWHQKQQRSVLSGDTIDQRIADVRTIYTSTDVAETLRLLHQYGVQYIYVGPLERLYYPGNGLDKFKQQQGRLWNAVYENDEVRIYRVD